MPLDLELTRLDSTPPPDLRAGASVLLDAATGRISLGGTEFATLSAEDAAKVSAIASSSSSSLQATVRTIRREKEAISSVTIRLVEAASTQARTQNQQHQHQNQQPRRGEK